MLIYSMSVSIGGTLYFAKAPAWLKAGTTTTIALRCKLLVKTSA